MQRVFVLDKNRNPLSPCHPARARALLRNEKAAVFRRFPFTIIMKEREGGDVQPIELKLDPGSRTTGVALVAQYQRGRSVVWAANLQHRGHRVREALLSRRQLRRGRRSRKTRYRQPRLDNRTRPAGWLPPSLLGRVHNCRTWGVRLKSLAPLSSVTVETVRFDTQALLTPEISGIEYQQGTLFGYEVREYLLEKFARRCVYCDGENVPLEIEHVVARSRSGSDRISNLALSCVPCNGDKGNRDVADFLAGNPALLEKLRAQLLAPLKDAAAVNATRYAIGDVMKELGLPTAFSTGGRTKFNRTRQGYPKEHWIDAACVGETGERVRLMPGLTPLEVSAAGRGTRQMCGTDAYGFPIRHRGRAKFHFGFRTGDMVQARVPTGKCAGNHTGRINVRSRPSFRLGKMDIHPRHITLLHSHDGYAYS
jgi:5-methylcytosine-specific restriction endonuclease McrA